MIIKIAQSPRDIEYLRNKVVGYDVETTGSPRDNYEPDHNLATIQIYSPEDDITWVVPLRTISGNLSPDQSLKDTLESLHTVGHYLQFDLDRTLNDLGVMPKVYGDTYLLACMLQWENKGLKSIAAAMLPGSKSVKHITEVVDVSYPIQWNLTNKEQLTYMANDPYYSYQIHKLLEEKGTVAKLGKAYQADIFALPQFARSRCRGIRVALDKYQALLTSVSQKVSDMEKDLNEKAGRTVKAGSPKDIQKLLWSELELPETPIKTKTGAPATSEESLRYIYDSHPVVPAILSLKHEMAVLSGSKKLPEFLYDDKRLHPEFRQIGMDATSRVYTSHPSATQYPMELRDCIIPDPGKKFLYFDWSAAELVLSAYWAKDKQLLSWYQEGDVIAKIAQKLLHKDEVTKEERDKVKVVIYSSLYGSEGAAAARTLRVPQSETEEIVRLFFKEFPMIAKLKATIEDRCKKTSYTHTIMGRPRKLSKMRNPEGSQGYRHALRQSFNTAIQSSVADCLKVSIGRTGNYLPQGVEFVITVFDSMLLQIPEEMTEEEYLPIIKRLSTFGGLVFKNKHSTGYSWKECQDKT